MANTSNSTSVITIPTAESLPLPMPSLAQALAASISQNRLPVDNFCSHPTILKRTCTVCGQELPEGHGLFFGYIMNDLRLNTTEADRWRQIETDNILSKKKLLLVLDLDETLLHSKFYSKASLPQDDELKCLENEKNVFIVQLESYLVVTKLRSYAREFLIDANTMFEIYVYTNASRDYARKMMELLDPENRFFHSRLIAKHDGTVIGQKNLDVVLGEERAIVILDNGESDWSKHNANLIKVSNYKYFDQNLVNRWISEYTGWGIKYLKILKKIHSKFFDSATVRSSSSSSRDVRKVIRRITRKQNLSNKTSSGENTCSHPAVLKSICINCRREVADMHGLRFDYIKHGLRLTETEADRMRSIETKILLSKRKLILVLDLDNTLLHTTPVFQEEEYLDNQLESPHDVFKVKLTNSSSYYVKLRPFVRDFLKQASTIFELYVYTNSCQDYATKMVKLLDPDDKYFDSRIISREDSTKSGQKNLDVVMGKERVVVILDNKIDVWPNHNGNVVQVQEYKYFASRNRALKGKSFAERNTDEDIKIMKTYLEILERIRTQFFCLRSRDVRDVMRKIQGGILKGRRLVLRNNSTDDNKVAHVRMMAEKMGAICVSKIDPSVTYVVFMEAKPEDDGVELLANEKKKKKKKTRYHSVLSTWIIDCYNFWHKFSLDDYMA
ncbi:RNA polymerase II C-terminal domain phosphatase-like 4 [Mercurialis annua]|uniref:RNA polymerase II C-terminal domain phosphatase-like 4 n=1 Tax=Mercurialis annua TaxID=3986 RepID=UPI00215EFB2E|nr:RNA polymerase II C-terminal domain phosphatase-like 4 [Mercurialis annua]